MRHLFLHVVLVLFLQPQQQNNCLRSGTPKRWQANQALFERRIYNPILKNQHRKSVWRQHCPHLHNRTRLRSLPIPPCDAFPRPHTWVFHSHIPDMLCFGILLPSSKKSFCASVVAASDATPRGEGKFLYLEGFIYSKLLATINSHLPKDKFGMPWIICGQQTDHIFLLWRMFNFLLFQLIYANTCHMSAVRCKTYFTPKFLQILKVIKYCHIYIKKILVHYQNSPRWHIAHDVLALCAKSALWARECKFLLLICA